MPRKKYRQLNETQKVLLADKILDLANYFVVGFVIAQAVTEQKDAIIIFAGVIIYLAFAAFALWLRR